MCQPAAFFSGCTGKGVRIVVADSGVHAGHPHVGGVAGGASLLPDGREGDDYLDRIGHGTAVAAAIREKAPEVEIFAAKIFLDVLATDADTLLRAMDWAVVRNARLVNFSLGTTELAHRDQLLAGIERARARRTIIVAAWRHGAEVWLPGALPGVLPVLLDWDCPRDEYRAVVSAEGRVAFAASGYPRDIPGVPRERNLKGISFAVANMTGFAARALETHTAASVEELIELLGAAGENA